MSIDPNLRSAVEDSRKVSDDGSLVTYDLTKNIDFSNPKKVAEALSDVFFEKDAVNWFKVSDMHIDFDPTYKVRIVMAEEHNKKLEDTVDDFLKDLKKEEIHPKFSKQLDEAAERATNVQIAMAGHSIRSVLYKHSERKIDEDYIQDDLFVDLLEKLEIRSLNDKDLMDWKNLPL